jgi:hypothetical protein
MAIFANCDGNPVVVSQAVLDGIEEARSKEPISDFSYLAVANEAENLGFQQAADWIRNNRVKYVCGVRHGFKVVV